MSVAEKGRRYRHYKKETMVYTVMEIALDCETVEPLVIYRSEYETPDHPKGTLWVRKKSDFESTVTLPDGRTMDRFTLIV